MATISISNTIEFMLPVGVIGRLLPKSTTTLQEIILCSYIFFYIANIVYTLGIINIISILIYIIYMIYIVSIIYIREMGAATVA